MRRNGLLKQLSTLSRPPTYYFRYLKLYSQYNIHGCDMDKNRSFDHDFFLQKFDLS